MNRQKSTFRISFYVRRTRPNKHGEVPVCVHITVNGRCLPVRRRCPYVLQGRFAAGSKIA